LSRELDEEVGVKIQKYCPLIQIQHHYPERSVLLTAWEIKAFSGIAVGKEKQRIKWVSMDSLLNYHFPEANKAIITAIQLPTDYAILNDANLADLRLNLERILQKGIKLIQFRLKNLTENDVKTFLIKALPLCQQAQAQVLMNSQVTSANKQCGLHLTRYDLMRLTQRPLNSGWIAASCHNLMQLQQAEKLGGDFVVLSPILPTSSHPDAQLLGWEKMAHLIKQVNIPVFALGGLNQKDKKHAQLLGAQGIAGIRTFL
jgi:8-oxo-dGTP diphosphatase